MSTRSNGGIIGPQNRTTTVAASGVWHLSDAQQSVLARNWPGFVPVAPSSPAVGNVTLGSGTLPLLLTATIPFTQGYNGGNAVTRVTAVSIPGGLTANTSGASPITISGLGSNTNYTFAVYQTNFYGDSPFGYSNPVQTASVPSAPIIGTATAVGPTNATVTFTASSSNGGTPITVYTATSTPGNVTGTSSTSPISISGLTASTTYTFKVIATNLVGNSATSNASNSITTSAGATKLLLVGGGASGGLGYTGGATSGGGGGGAGGIIYDQNVALSVGTTYSFVVGAGGASLVGTTARYTGRNGANTTVNYSSYNAIGGGGGGGTSGADTGSLSGGSGGGGTNFNGGNSPGASGLNNNNPAGVGFGNNGGSQSGFTGPNYPSAGGGGAGAVGGDVLTASAGGIGGDGKSIDITGTAVYYAGGGGGSTYAGGTPGAGGAGGGGAGARSNSGLSATGGTDGLGGGGGGICTSNNALTSGKGGDGVAILAVPTSEYTGVYTGSPTIKTFGIYTILKFTGNGSYTR